jgi:hypothetical protein
MIISFFVSIAGRLYQTGSLLEDDSSSFEGFNNGLAHWEGASEQPWCESRTPFPIPYGEIKKNLWVEGETHAWGKQVFIYSLPSIKTTLDYVFLSESRGDIFREEKT